MADENDGTEVVAGADVVDDSKPTSQDEPPQPITEQEAPPKPDRYTELNARIDDLEKRFADFVATQQAFDSDEHALNDEEMKPDTPLDIDDAVAALFND